MLLVRQLLYKEKSLDDFEIESEHSIFKLFFEQLLTMDGTKVTDLNVEKNITSMFNDACYICTVALIIKRPALQLGYFRELCNQKTFKGTYYSTNEARADVVLCMVYFLLKHCCEGDDNTKNLMAVIDTNLRERSRESYYRYERFFDACNSFQGMLFPGYFNKVTITPEVLSSMDTEWKTITRNYDKKQLTELVSYWKEPRQRNLIIDAIEAEVNRTHFDEDDLPF